MTIRARAVLVAAWLISLIAAGAVAGQLAYRFEPLPEPIVLSGSDIGFRVEGRLGAQPAGHIVIRLNGQWVVPTQQTDRLPSTR
jgi:hypothetical protein